MNPSVAVRKFLTLRDSPEALARGSAIGLFLGFTPLFGLKTVLSVLFAALVRGNKIAAVMGATIHDVALPFIPILWRIEYDIGFWLLSNPHRLPTALRHLHLKPQDWLSWTTFLNVGAPVLLGSLIIGAPLSALAFFAIRGVLERRHQRAAAEQLKSEGDAE
jgi:uncharacterized protein (DUF2062 family)